MLRWWRYRFSHNVGTDVGSDGRTGAKRSRFYFCLLLAGKNPAEFMAGHSNIDLHSLVALATPAQKAEILVMIASWVSESKEEPRHSAQELKTR